MKFLTSIDLSQNEIQNAIMQPLAAPPANPKIGQIYFNSIDLTLYLWTGEKWIPVPTKTSQLENDSGFITSGDIPEGAAASTTTPKMNGTAAVGTEMAFARGDHVHPKAAAPADTQGDRGVHQAARPSAERQDADPPAEERHRLPRFSHLPHADRQGREKSASQEHRQHEAQDPQVPRAGGLRQDDTRQRRAILRELDGPHLTRQHLPPAAEHGRLFLQLFPGAQTITERRQHSWPKN